MSIWKLPVEWAVYSTIEIEADTLEEAVRIAHETIDEIPLPKESEYIEDSFIIGSMTGEYDPDTGEINEADLEYYKLF